MGIRKWVKVNFLILGVVLGQECVNGLGLATFTVQNQLELENAGYVAIAHRIQIKKTRLFRSRLACRYPRDVGLWSPLLGNALWVGHR